MIPRLIVIAVITLVCFAWLAGCGGPATEPPRQYPLRGTVVELGDDRLKIDHQAIPGYMGAMVMTFLVEKPELLRDLKPGDQVHGQLRVTGGQPVLVELKKD